MASFFVPNWPMPKGVRACITTRESGASRAPFDAFNLALHVEDDAEQVLMNRQALLAANQGLNNIQWLQQVHGTQCVVAKADGIERTADACFSDKQGIGCAVMTADCLPVLFCSADGREVAAAHAGWRGLVAGVLAETLATFTAKPSQISAYLGPAIGPLEFEVGFEVLEKFFEAARNVEHLEAVSKAFKPSSKPLHFYADLYALARAELTALGVTEIYGGDYCTVSDTERFYSYRRNAKTGRMVSMIWRG